MTSTDARVQGDPAPTDAAEAWRPPLLWRALLVLARLATPLFCRLRVTGEVPRGRPLVLACNHIGIFDPIALVAAARVLRVAPRVMTTAGVFRVPLVGVAMRRCGHIAVDRRNGTGGAAFGAALDAVRAGSVVAAYPEGRITLDPGMWPERGRTGLARLALASGAVVVPVAQWGAHEVLAWDGAGAMAGTAFSSLWRRPLVRVHFGPPVDVSGLDPEAATDRVMEAIIAALAPLRAGEPGLPRYVDPTRPVSSERTYRPARSG